MSQTVYDTRFVAAANGNISNMRENSQLSKRIKFIKEFTDGLTIARFNSKLLQEYGKHIKEYRNEVVKDFFKILIDSGKRSSRSSLSKAEWESIRGAWHTHDKHLLAAAIEGIKPRVITSEKALIKRQDIIKRVLGITVILCE